MILYNNLSMSNHETRSRPARLVDRILRRPRQRNADTTKPVVYVEAAVLVNPVYAAARLQKEYEQQKSRQHTIDLFHAITWSASVEKFYDDIQKKAEEEANKSGTDFYKNVAYGIVDLRAVTPQKRAELYFTRELDLPEAITEHMIDAIALGIGDGQRKERTINLSQPVTNSTLDTENNLLLTLRHVQVLLGLPVDSPLMNTNPLQLTDGENVEETYHLPFNNIPVTLTLHGDSQRQYINGKKTAPYVSLTVNKALK